jgi:Toastrack DUF4097
MRPSGTLAVISLTAVVLTLSFATTSPHATASGQASSPQQWRGAIQPGNVIEVKGVNGGITASAAAGAEAEVSAVMRARRSNPQDVRIDIVPHGGGVTICAVYPSEEGRPPNECQPGDGGRMNVRDNDVTVAFTVRVPAGVHFVGKTVNGDVAADSLAGPVSLKTVNGEATFSTSSYGEASSVNGSIRGTLGSSQWTETLNFKSVNGSITLDLPSDASTDVNATTVNGTISTDFPITVLGRMNPRRLSGTIGGGGRSLEVETVNGSVTLRRR